MELINELGLQYGKCDGVFYDNSGKIAAFDSSVNKQNAGVVIRKDLLDLFLKKTNLNLVWFVNASKEIHNPDFTINKYSDWMGLLKYDNDKIIGEVFQGNKNV